MNFPAHAKSRSEESRVSCFRGKGFGGLHSPTIQELGRDRMVSSGQTRPAASLQGALSTGLVQQLLATSSSPGKGGAQQGERSGQAAVSRERPRSLLSWFTFRSEPEAAQFRAATQYADYIRFQMKLFRQETLSA